MLSILFVSHDRELRAVASRVLRKGGWQVTAVAHGGHALLACVDGQTFDVVVAEDQMPDHTGVGLARQLRRYCPGIQVVCLRDEPGQQVHKEITVVQPLTADDLIAGVLEAAAATIAAA